MANSFCMYCTGGDKDEVRNCGDTKCPFYPERAANMEWQVTKREQREEAVHETLR